MCCLSWRFHARTECPVRDGPNEARVSTMFWRHALEARVSTDSGSRDSLEKRLKIMRVLVHLFEHRVRYAFRRLYPMELLCVRRLMAPTRGLALLMLTRLHTRRSLWKGSSIFSRATENGPAFLAMICVCTNTGTQRSAGPFTQITPSTLVLCANQEAYLPKLGAWDDHTTAVLPRLNGSETLSYHAVSARNLEYCSTWRFRGGRMKYDACGGHARGCVRRLCMDVYDRLYTTYTPIDRHHTSHGAHQIGNSECVQRFGLYLVSSWSRVRRQERCRKSRWCA